MFSLPRSPLELQGKGGLVREWSADRHGGRREPLVLIGKHTPQVVSAGRNWFCPAMAETYPFETVSDFAFADNTIIKPNK